MADVVDWTAFERMHGTKVAVVGDYCLDAYWDLDPDTRQTSVETGLPVRTVVRQRYGLGGAGNVVANLVALGVREIRAIGVVGTDPFAPILNGLLQDLNVDISAMHEAGPPWQTPTYIKPMDAGMELP